MDRTDSRTDRDAAQHPSSPPSDAGRAKIRFAPLPEARRMPTPSVDRTQDDAETTDDEANGLRRLSSIDPGVGRAAVKLLAPITRTLSGSSIEDSEEKRSTGWALARSVSADSGVPQRPIYPNVARGGIRPAASIENVAAASEPKFEEWGGLYRGAASDDDDGSGMAWVRKRKEERRLSQLKAAQDAERLQQPSEPELPAPTRTLSDSVVERQKKSSTDTEDEPDVTDDLGPEEKAEEDRLTKEAAQSATARSALVEKSGARSSGSPIVEKSGSQSLGSPVDHRGSQAAC